MMQFQYQCLQLFWHASRQILSFSHSIPGMNYAQLINVTIIGKEFQEIKLLELNVSKLSLISETHLCDL